MAELDEKRFVIFGKQGSGKTELVKHILRSTKNHIVYDRTRHDYPGFTRYLPNDSQSAQEMSDFVLLNIVKNPNRPRLFVLDEANLFLQPKPSRLPTGIAELNDLGRHLKMTWGVVSRLPSQFHSDITQLADHIFIYRLNGYQDKQYLNKILVGGNIGDRAANLQPFHFLHYDVGAGSVTLHSPIDIT